jgi:radical SAM protein with 4Fe4S-binding SPASM domain
METQAYADWSLEVHERFIDCRIPFSGVVEVTQRCNNTCVHCYNNLPSKNQEARFRELAYEEHCRILDEIADSGCLWLLFTGGEIFLRQDFLDIYTYAKKKGLLITLFTNGTLITPKIADYLVKWRPFSIEITLYGRTRQTYEQITGVFGSFDRCLRGIQLLLERELPLKLKTMAITLNKHEIWEMKRFVEEQLKLDFKFDAVINPRCDCSQSPLEVRLTPAEVVELDLKDPDRMFELKRFCERFDGNFLSPEKAEMLWQCGGGQNSFAIDPYGMLRMCVLSSHDSYSLRQGSFQDGWEHFLYKLRQQKISRRTKCVTCAIKAMCGVCPANAQLECKDAEAPVDFLCRVAHLRAYAFGIPLRPHGDCEYCRGGKRYEEMMKTANDLRERYAPVKKLHISPGML